MMKLKHTAVFAATITVAFTLSSCALPPAPPVASMRNSKDLPAKTDMIVLLDKTQWSLANYANADGQLAPAVSGSQAWIEFADGKISGRAGCNTFSAGYTQAGTALTFTAARNTLMACDDARMAQERGVLDGLNQTRAFAIDADQLTLQNSQGKAVLVFNHQQPTPITGSTWHLTGVNNGTGGVVSAVSGVDVTARFEDGKVTGNGGCNGYGTSFTTDGDKIKFEPFMTTLRACANDDATQQESWYFAALAKVATYRIREGKLELRDADGALQAAFAAE